MPEEVTKSIDAEPTVNYQRGISQENLEDLRSEYTPIGSILPQLPEPSEVRDWATVGIIGKDTSGEDILELWQMIDGEWWNLGDFRKSPRGAGANINILNQGSQYAVASSSEIYEVNKTNETTSADDWVLTDSFGTTYSDGVITVSRAGFYSISWSASITAGTDNQQIEIGILLNSTGGSADQTTFESTGWSQVKILTAANMLSLSASTILKLKRNDRISLGYENLTSTANIFIDHAHLQVITI